jgi:DNA-binding transcriptional regulator YhcF (GntR family)
MTEINAKLKTPKYQQIINITLEKIKSNILKKGDILPSLNFIAQEYRVSKDTVVKAYNRLREMNIIGSQHGKFFYIKNEYIDYDKKVLLLFDILQTYRENLYKGIINNIDNRVYLDFYFYNFNAPLFKRMIEDNLEGYDYFIVIPFPNTAIRKTIQKVDQKKLLILDRAEELDSLEEFARRNCSIIYQNHNYELEKALDKGVDLINKYKKMTLVFPENIHAPEGIKDAFLRFTSKELFLIITDNDLVNIIKASKKKNLEIGKDIGIISYNDAPLKEVVENGITVVSIDWYEMGVKTAKLINQPTKIQVLEPTNLIIRNSL